MSKEPVKPVSSAVDEEFDVFSDEVLGQLSNEEIDPGVLTKALGSLGTLSEKAIREGVDRARKSSNVFPAELAYALGAIALKFPKSVLTELVKGWFSNLSPSACSLEMLEGAQFALVGVANELTKEQLKTLSNSIRLSGSYRELIKLLPYLTQEELLHQIGLMMYGQRGKHGELRLPIIETVADMVFQLRVVDQELLCELLAHPGICFYSDKILAAQIRALVGMAQNLPDTELCPLGEGAVRFLFSQKEYQYDSRSPVWALITALKERLNTTQLDSLAQDWLHELVKFDGSNEGALVILMFIWDKLSDSVCARLADSLVGIVFHEIQLLDFFGSAKKARDALGKIFPRLSADKKAALYARGKLGLGAESSSMRTSAVHLLQMLIENSVPVDPLSLVDKLIGAINPVEAEDFCYDYEKITSEYVSRALCSIESQLQSSQLHLLAEKLEASAPGENAGLLRLKVKAAALESIQWRSEMEAREAQRKASREARRRRKSGHRLLESASAGTRGGGEDYSPSP